jgi:hypothetical protein
MSQKCQQETQPHLTDTAPRIQPTSTASLVRQVLRYRRALFAKRLKFHAFFNDLFTVSAQIFLISTLF